MSNRNLPPINDHDFMRLVRKLVNGTPSRPMTRIAFDLGVDVDDLCAWVMAYREPRRSKEYVNRSTPSAGKSIHHDWSTAKQAQRFENWRRAQAGAAKTRADA